MLLNIQNWGLGERGEDSMIFPSMILETKIN